MTNISADSNVLDTSPTKPRSEGQPSTLATIAVMAILGCSYTFNGLDRSVFPALLAPISSELGLDLAQGGFLSNVFTLNIAIFGALSGWFMIRFGRKTTLVGGLIAYSIFTLLIPLARSYGELTFYRAMTGAGEALHIAAIFSMIGAFFGARRGTFLGINNAFFGVGTFLAPIVGTQMYAALGSWRPPFYLFGVAGIVAALAVLFFVPNTFSEAEDGEDVDRTRFADAECPDNALNPNSAACVIAFFLTGYSFLSYMALYTLFLKQHLGYSVVDAGTAFSMYGVGSLTAFVGGWVGDRLKRYGLLVCLVIMALDGYLMFNVVVSLIGQMVLSFVFGAMLSGFLFPRFLAVVQRCVRPAHVGTAMSMMIPVFYLAGFVAGPTFGALVPVLGWSTAGAVSVTLTAVAAALVTCLINPRRMRGN
ncbi:MFS family permease [Bradyrhizobium elkanii]